MTEQELVQEIATELCLYCKKNNDDVCAVDQPCKASLTTAQTIRAFFQGYVKLADNQMLGASLAYLLGKHGQFKLYEDYPDNFNRIIGEIERVMIETGWRRVELVETHAACGED